MRTRRRGPVLLLLVVIAILAAGAATMPWAFHFGGRPTPFLTWWGSGVLRANGGIDYPFFMMLHPSASFSRLHLDGKRPTGGLAGNACLCLPGAATQYVKVSGTIYDGWRSTEGSLISLRLLEPIVANVTGRQGGYLDLYGGWNGPDLKLTDRGSYARSFLSGLRIQHASATLRWHVYWTCKSACAGLSNERTNP